MRAVQPLDRLIRLIGTHTTIERMIRFKTVPGKVKPGVVKKQQSLSPQPLPIPGFGTSGRTIPVRHAAPSSFLAYYPVTQPVPGTSLSRSMRSRIAAKSGRGTATSAIWKVTALERETTLAPILISFSRSVVKLQGFTS